MHNIKIEATVWHAQLYMWGLRLWKTFASSYEYIHVSSHTNICQYVRVLMLAFIAATGYLFVAAHLGATFIYYPSVYFGWDYWAVVGYILAAIMMIVFIVVAVIIIGSGWDSFKLWWSEKTLVTKKLEALVEGTPNRPSLVSLAKKYVESHTEGFCAGIEIVAPAATDDETRHKVVADFDVYVPVQKQDEKPGLVTVDSISSSRIMFLPVWWKLVGILLFSAFFLFCFGQEHDSNREIVAEWEGECEVGTWENKESRLLVNLTCHGKETQVSDVETLLSYINKPDKKPHCFADMSGELYCKVKDKKRMK